MNILDVIAHRRDKVPHLRDELSFLANGAANGSIPDYQLSAWLMAAYLNPLSEEETAWLTLAMAESGERIDLTGLPKPWVDKHSTGGVGDKTTIALLPVLAACGLTVVKMSGRGLGITGGTVDKLASIPGFRLDLTPDEMKAQAGRIGLALTGQSPNLAPADKAFYALRDVTATISSIPLIVSSILSKKIAGGAEVILIDVKCGAGAFMRTRQDAEELATWLRKIGTLCGLQVTAELSDMDQPLGAAVGNALEVREAFEVLRGGIMPMPSQRFLELVRRIAVEALTVSGKLAEKEALVAVEQSLMTGKALAKAREWVQAQGGDPRVVDEPNRLPHAPVVSTVSYEGPTGSVQRVDAAEIGQLVVDMGGGRKAKSDEIDPSVGVVLDVSVGMQVDSGQQVATIHAATKAMADGAAERILKALTVF
ncbi:MAG: thymidine phosphorylase [Fimbriimonadaceae bacterium]|nr:thymidine phosphorylase [Fimbriimonadaceae bacterium]